MLRASFPDRLSVHHAEVGHYFRIVARVVCRLRAGIAGQIRAVDQGEQAMADVAILGATDLGAELGRTGRLIHDFEEADGQPNEVVTALEGGGV